MSDNQAPTTAPVQVGPPSRHQLALMIWIAVFPTLTVLNLTIGPRLPPPPVFLGPPSPPPPPPRPRPLPPRRADAAPVLRTFVLATIAAPIVISGLMPRLQQARARLLARR